MAVKYKIIMKLQVTFNQKVTIATKILTTSLITKINS